MKTKINLIAISIIAIFMLTCSSAYAIIGITSDQTWNTNASINEDIYISNGATLTITNGAVIDMGDYNRVIVYPEARLIVDNATITNTNNEHPWEGIEVWGDPNENQWERMSNGMSLYQGEVIIKNNSTISNALNAVRALHHNGNDYVWNTGGGIIKAYNSNFINNYKGIWLGGYHNYYDGREIGNMSRIYNCTFETNNNLNGYYIPYEFIGLCGVDMYSIKGNTFINTNMNLSFDDRGRGIVSYGSKVIVEPLCQSPLCQNPDKNSFENLLYGVFCFTLNDEIVRIENNLFTNCSKAIFLNQPTSAIVTQNEIEVGSGVSNPDDNMPYAYGIYLHHGHGFKVEENNILRPSGAFPWDSKGIIAYNTGCYFNELYRNELTNLSEGIAAYDLNKHEHPAEFEGLKILCNDFDEPYQVDIFVSAYEHPNPFPGLGIAGFQFMQNPDPTLPAVGAGNIFSSPRSTPPPSPPLDLLNKCAEIHYHYESNATVKYEPTHYTTSSVTNVPHTNQNSCPSNLNSWNDLPALYTSIGNAQVALNSSLTILNIWKDMGEADLEEEVATIQPWEVYQEFNELIAGSPYLSEDVLIAVIENSSFTSLMVKLLMIANPHSVNSDEVMSALYERLPPLPESYIDEILAIDGTVSQLKKLEGHVSADEHELTMIKEDIKRFYRADTTHFWAKDSLINFVSRQNSLNDRYELATIYLRYQQYEDMNTCLNNIPQEFELNDQQESDYENYLVFYDIAEDYYSGEGLIDVLTQDQVNDLEDIENLKRPNLSGKALSLLMMNDPGYEFYEPVVFPDEELLPPLIRFDLPDMSDNESGNEEVYLKLFPNPAHDFTTLEYRTASIEYLELKLEVYDSRGKLVLQKALEAGDREELLDLSALASGLHVVRLLADGKLLDSKKLTVQ